MTKLSREKKIKICFLLSLTQRQEYAIFLLGGVGEGLAAAVALKYAIGEKRCVSYNPLIKTESKMQK
jgi:hypothetical protein